MKKKGNYIYNSNMICYSVVTAIIHDVITYIMSYPLSRYEGPLESLSKLIEIRSLHPIESGRSDISDIHA